MLTQRSPSWLGVSFCGRRLASSTSPAQPHTHGVARPAVGPTYALAVGPSSGVGGVSFWLVTVARVRFCV